ncbi:RNA-binding protein [Labrys monachus]|uniref:RNA-binding protein YlxR (DUF448 family) n=1 Tax=Labrys monachus TaxID=217067 RepID=A0ABU0FCY4_9HYPH|nr:RNA-binding protein [Labrys monachus]MDQ0392449.1 putative RNA-binding protein YlxR (DUF448 family) [Labrys monachus]
MRTGRTEDADDRQARERLCVATRLVQPVGTLLRLVVSPDGVLTPDLKRSLPGRGVWVTATRAAFTEAVRKKAFVRSLKHPAEVPADLADTIDRLLERAALDMLGLANKAGLVIPGYAKVMDAIESRRAAAVIQARDGAEDGLRKLAQAVRRAYLEKNAPSIVMNFDSAHLDLALGRSNVIHAALCAGPAATGFLDRVAALTFWRDGGLAPAQPQPSQEVPPHADDEPSTQDAGPSRDGVIGIFE